MTSLEFTEERGPHTQVRWRNPSDEECSANTNVVVATWLLDGAPNNVIRGTAFWHPQLGGYSAGAVMVAFGGCFDVYLWHDGEFPYGGDRPPQRIHYCCSDQLRRMADLADKLNTMEERK